MRCLLSFWFGSHTSHCQNHTLWSLKLIFKKYINVDNCERSIIEHPFKLILCMIRLTIWRFCRLDSTWHWCRWCWSRGDRFCFRWSKYTFFVHSKFHCINRNKSVSTVTSLNEEFYLVNKINFSSKWND